MSMKIETPRRRWMFALCMMGCLTAVPAVATAQDPGPGTLVDDVEVEDEDGMDMGWLGLLGLAGLLGLKRRDHTHTHTGTHTGTHRP